MSKLPVAFDPLTLPESNATRYPAKFRADNQKRWIRRLSSHARLRNFGVNITRIIPGGQSSARHTHSKQDEFIYVLQGEVVLQTNAGAETMRPGMCVGFPAGGGNAHRFVNRSKADVLLLVVGDRTPGDEISYPDIDNRARMDASGNYVYTRKDGTPHRQRARSKP
ncbi:MAG: cupin domain-containing protein [Alphaproteobacteria bacterium]|nr:cupin domain-containing protein [Alphaproteobacteria bacterium]